MSLPPEKPAIQPAAAAPGQNPADIAREAFRRLAARRIAPTPNAYRDIYNEIAGISEPLDIAAPAAVLAASTAAGAAGSAGSLMPAISL